MLQLRMSLCFVLGGVYSCSSCLDLQPCDDPFIVLSAWTVTLTSPWSLAPYIVPVMLLNTPC